MVSMWTEHRSRCSQPPLRRWEQRIQLSVANRKAKDFFSGKAVDTVIMGSWWRSLRRDTGPDQFCQEFYDEVGATKRQKVVRIWIQGGDSLGMRQKLKVCFLDLRRHSPCFLLLRLQTLRNTSILLLLNLHKDNR